jgi:hypothetical protein
LDSVRRELHRTEPLQQEDRTVLDVTVSKLGALQVEQRLDFFLESQAISQTKA